MQTELSERPPRITPPLPSLSRIRRWIMNSMPLDLVKSEKEAQDLTVKSHFEVFELVAIMLNIYINGFNLIGKLSDKNSDTDWAWLFLITRSFYSLRCSVELMKKAYYAQAMSLIRIVTEAYFLCGNCKYDQTIIEAILHNKPNRPDGRTIFNYKALAKNMDSLVMYEKDYTFECKFSHTSSLSLGIMTTRLDTSSRELKPIPVYDEILFIACCELAFKNGLLMTSFLEKLLGDLSQEKVNTWRLQVRAGIQQISEWLDGLKQKYGDIY